MILKNTVRKEKFSLIANTVKSIEVYDTTPNCMYIINNSNYKIYVSDSPNVSSTNFKYKVPANGSKVYIDIGGYKKLFFVATSNASNIEVQTMVDNNIGIGDIANAIFELFVVTA